jgi:hypothetical protein
MQVTRAGKNNTDFLKHKHNSLPELGVFLDNFG